MTARDRVALWLKLIAPAVVDRMAKAALARPHFRAVPPEKT